ncbi:myosin-like coiled-coil protein-domain-containing protein [Lineolata rhizophorae]|uniref:Myosin-like coiled-coil protein-domain-containing protein n=1 Tax=Lineolata rhizophorae TaxID=578093 RepID=A0A6A6NTK1_9PEZI|nr:myosin-like coiled-coil protein-domain-containing protein [Lineolata rhizophorae]
MDKINFLTKRYTDLLADMKKLERECTRSKKKADQLQKEKDKQGQELNRISGMKDNLEKLSRNVTKDNKKLQEKVKAMEENQGRVNDELHARLMRVAEPVEQVINSKETPQVPVVDIETDKLFKEKFKSFLEQYEARELQFMSVLRSKELEIQYQMAKLEEQKKAQEKESTKSNKLTRQVSTFSKTEEELRSQLNIYVEKFKQVEDTLNNSNDLFLTFRKEMEEMSKKTKRLEKQNQNLTRKQEATNRNILEMAEERTRTEKELETLRKKNMNLEKLCRGMQAQGRGQVNTNQLNERDVDVDETASEFEYDEDDEGSGDYDDDTEEEALEQRPRAFGPIPPPPAHQATSSGKENGQAGRPLVNQTNGIRR